MSTTVEIKDPSLIEIPSDMIQLGFTDDGMPITEPTDKAVAEGKEEPKTATLADLEQMKRERDEATERLTAEAAAKAKAEAEAKAAREAAEALTGKLGKTEGVLHDRTIQSAAAHYRSVYSEHQQITSAIASTEALAASYEKELAAASEAGDHVKVAATQRAIARAEAHLAQLEAGKSAAEQEVKRAERVWQDVNAAPPVEEPKPKKEAEPKKVDEPEKPNPEAWIAQFPKKTTAAWLNTHKDYVTDPDKHKKLLAFANEWYNEGNPLHTKDFVAALTAEFAPEEVEMTEETPVKAAAVTEAKPKAKATPAAPVSRGGGVFSSTNLNASQVKLPADVVAFCKASGLDPTSYALSVVDEIKRGQKPKEWLDPGYDRGIR